MDNLIAQKLSARAFVKQALADVFNNFRTAIYISRAYIILLFISAIFMASMGIDIQDKVAPLNSNLGIYVFVVTLLSGYVAASTAINWHRFIINNQVNSQLLESPGIIFRYIGRSILISLLLVILALPVFAIGGILKVLGFVSAETINGQGSSLSAMIIFGIGIAFVFITLITLSSRYFSSLPSLVVDEKPIGLRQTLKSTKGTTWFFIKAFILEVLLMGLLTIPFTLLTKVLEFVIGKTSSSFLYVDLLIQVPFNILNTLIFISIITNSYKLFLRGNVVQATNENAVVG